MRRKLARYENIAATILDTVTGALFTENPARSFKSDQSKVRVWQDDVDGKGTNIDQFMQQAWLVAGVFSHAILLLDKAPMEGTSAADVGMPKLVRYTPLDLIDWLTDEDGDVTAVKLLEAAPRTDFGARVTANDVRVRVVDDTSWTLYDHSGKEIAQGDHGFGRLPVVLLYGKRRTLTPMIGKPVMGDPQLYIDAYNLISEIRELLRNQTFAILNIPLGKDADVERERGIVGSQSGTSNVLMSTEQAGFISPSADNVTVYHEHLDRLQRMIYRLCSLPWDGDSKDAESADSRRLKRADLNSVLLKYTAELQQADRDVTELAYRALYGTSWETQWESEEPTTAYSHQFELPDMEQVAARASELLGLELGDTASKEVKKRTVRAGLPNLDEATLKQIDEEIEAIPVLTAQEKQEELLKGAAERMAGRPMGKPGKAVAPAKDDKSDEPPPAKKDAAAA